jgi:GDP-4-dehydro-6-deoxy-D-mannose reductase
MTFILDQVQPDIVFHLAAQPLVSASLRDPWTTLETNIRMQLNVLEGVHRVKPDCRVLVIGSAEEYGLVRPQELPIDEDTPLRPLNAYAVSKVAQDLMGQQYHLTHGLDVVRVRPFNHIGPRQRLGFVAPDFASQIAAIEKGLQEPVMRVGNLDVRRDFCDVRDVIQAYVLLSTYGKPGQVYNVGAGESHAIQELLDILLDNCQVHVQVQPESNRMRPSDVPEVVCDASRLRRDTGWKPTIPFEQSLKDILDYWRQETKDKS